jgi:acyl-[acyl carrier protein]--UDP-N-acetylglucosamine O-acyltransferase
MNFHPTAVIAPDVKLGAQVQHRPLCGDRGGRGARRRLPDRGPRRDQAPHAHRRAQPHRRTRGDRRRPAGLQVQGGHLSYTEIGEDNYFREGVTIHRGSRQDSVTRIGNGCFLMAYAHIAHDCIVGNNVVMANTAGIAGEVVVHDKAFISAAVTVHQFCRIGRNAMIGLSAKVVQDALPFCITDGNPGRARGLNLVGLKRNGFTRRTSRR